MPTTKNILKPIKLLVPFCLFMPINKIYCRHVEPPIKILIKMKFRNSYDLTFFDFSTVFSCQFSKICQKIANRNDFRCKDL